MKLALSSDVAAPARASFAVPEGPDGSVRAAFGHVRPIYIPVHLDGLVLDSVVDFHLYLQTSPGHFVLFRGPDLEFTTGHHQRLLANRVETLWLKGDERRRYEQYVERHLETLLSNPQIATPRKVELLQSAAQTTLEAVMVDPRHTEALPRTRRVAQQTVQLLVRDRDAMAHMAALMARDYDTVRHSMNVSVFATGLAHAVGVNNPGDLRDLALGGLLHDIGKSELPRELIVKPGAYTEEEMTLMRTHVSRGEHILQADGRMGALGMVVVSQHHERLTGNGYPRNLDSQHIHLFGRIAAIADVYDAMTSDRSYQRAMKPVDALHLMSTHLAPHFDRNLLQTFVKTLRAPRTQ
ncbi:MAG TPA: HD domain-containing phosphohydrolase [Luteitalea sp.]|nr:HD domain-containing phosphohydrolase [Luteitalea sp.]